MAEPKGTPQTEDYTKEPDINPHGPSTAIDPRVVQQAINLRDAIVSTNPETGSNKAGKSGSGRNKRKRSRKGKQQTPAGEKERSTTSKRHVEEPEKGERTSEPKGRSITDDMSNAGWDGISSGRGLFEDPKMEKLWFKLKIRDQLPVTNPQQLVQLGNHMFKKPLEKEAYTAGEGFIVHCVASFYKDLPAIGYHIGAVKVIHYFAREHLGLELDQDETVATNVEIIKDLNLKHIAYKLSDYILPAGAESHTVLTDGVQLSEICDCIDTVARADYELYLCYSAIGHMIELSPSERTATPGFFKYLYPIEMYVDEISDGNNPKESVILFYESICPSDPHADMIERIRAESEDDEEGTDIDEDDILQPPQAGAKTDEKELAGKGEAEAVKKGQQVASGNTVTKNKRKRKLGDQVNPNDEISVENSENDSDDVRIIRQPREDKVSAEQVPELVSLDTFVKVMKKVTTQIQLLGAQQKEIIKNQNIIKEQIGQKANQADPDPESREDRTVAITSNLMKRKVPESTKGVAMMTDSDKLLVKKLSKQSVTESEMHEILEQLKSRLAETSKAPIIKTLTTKKLLSKVLRDRLVEALKEVPTVVSDINIAGTSDDPQDKALKEIFGSTVADEGGKVTDEDEESKKKKIMKK